MWGAEGEVAVEEGFEAPAVAVAVDGGDYGFFAGALGESGEAAGGVGGGGGGAGAGGGC